MSPKLKIARSWLSKHLQNQDLPMASQEAPKRPHEALKCVPDRFRDALKRPQEASESLQDRFPMSQTTKQVHMRLEDTKLLAKVPSKFDISRVRTLVEYHTQHLFHNQVS